MSETNKDWQAIAEYHQKAAAKLASEANDAREYGARMQRERDDAREREKSLLLRLGQEKDHSEHVMARLNDSDNLRLAIFADLAALRAVADEMERALKQALCPDQNCDGKGNSWHVEMNGHGEPEQVQHQSPD